MGCDKKHIGLRVRYTYSISNFSERGYVTIFEPGDSTRFYNSSNLVSKSDRLLRFGPNVDFGLCPLQTRLEPPPKLGMHPHVPVGPRPAELDRGFLAPESCPLAPPAASEAPR